MGWLKLWDDEWLEKNKNKDLALQGAMVRLMCVANVSFDNGRFTHRGKVSLTTEQIIQMADIDEKLWLGVVESGFVYQQNNVWMIAGWAKYQSEYARKKGYIRKPEGKKQIKKDRSVGQPVETGKNPHLDVKDSKEVKDVKDVIDVKEFTEGKDRYQGKTSPQIEGFLDWYNQEFERRFGKASLTAKTKDTCAAKVLLDKYDLNKAKSLCISGWESTNTYHRNKSMTVSGLADVANELEPNKATRKTYERHNGGSIETYPKIKPDNSMVVSRPLSKDDV